MFIQKHKFNRDADPGRVDIIIESFNSGNYVPPNLFVGEVDGSLFCYDGNHRREAFLKANTPDDFQIILDVMFNTNHEALKSAFVAINESVQVPEQYMNFIEDDLKTEVSNIVKDLVLKYPDFVKHRVRYQKPHFNRDHLENHFYKIVSEDFNGNITSTQLKECLTILNDRYKLGAIPLAGSANSKRKCKKFDFYLFQSSSGVDIGHLRTIMTEKGYL